jgi:rhamnosyltransferase
VIAVVVELPPDADTSVFMKQNAALAEPNALENLVAAFDNLQVGATNSQQSCRLKSEAVEAHARGFNYPANFDLRHLASREQLGFKAIFFSISFADCRRSVLMNE